MASVLYLAWQDPQSRRWFTIGRLRKLDTGDYEFVYVAGYEEARAAAGMEPLVGFMEPNLRYLSNRLFPLFQNRIMTPSREDYGAYLRKLGFDKPPQEPIEILARSEGHRTTDSFQVFRAPALERIDGRLHCTFEFFIHGMRHVRPEVHAIEIERGSTLYLMWDFQNPHDSNALTLRTSANHLLGWVPRYYCAELLELHKRGHAMHVAVARMNKELVPSWFRIMCRLTAECPEAFRPFARDEFRPLAPLAEL